MARDTSIYWCFRRAGTTPNGTRWELMVPRRLQGSLRELLSELNRLVRCLHDFSIDSEGRSGLLVVQVTTSDPRFERKHHAWSTRLEGRFKDRTRRSCRRS